MPSRPFNVIYAFALTETFAAYILIRGILYPFIVSGMSTAQAIVGGVLQALIAAGMTYFGLRFYRGRFGSRMPMILITLCALWVTASTLIMNVSAEHWPVHHDCGCYRCGGCLRLRAHAQ